MDKKYRVYVYCDPRFTNKGNGYQYSFGRNGKIKLKYRPFYVGCALGLYSYRRHLWKRKEGRTGRVNHGLLKKIQKIKSSGLEPRVLIVKCISDKERARNLEEKLIVGMGRKDLKTGFLLNRSDGPGGKNPSFESREKNRLGSSGKNNPMYGRKGELAPMYGKHHSLENKFKIGINQRGEKNHESKITFLEKEEILYLYYADGWRQAEIAKKFNVSRNGCIQRVVSGTRWNYSELSAKELCEKYSNRGD